MTADKVYLTAEQAEQCLDIRDGLVHCFVDAHPVLLGTEWPIEDVRKALNDAEHIELGGELCRGMGHGIVVFSKNCKYQSDLHFFAHVEDELARYD